MKRRTFIETTFLMAMTANTATNATDRFSGDKRGVKEDKKPHIILIMTDRYRREGFVKNCQLVVKEKTVLYNPNYPNSNKK